MPCGLTPDFVPYKNGLRFTRIARDKFVSNLPKIGGSLKQTNFVVFYKTQIRRLREQLRVSQLLQKAVAFIVFKRIFVKLADSYNKMSRLIIVLKLKRV